MPALNPDSEGLPVHFFTLVLNGQPFIREHIEQFKKLPFQWHWHIIEGVAEHKFDTAWSLANGASIPQELHCRGLSNDGTTEYLDQLQAEYPDRVSVYRKADGRFWAGKLEMVNEPLRNIQTSCLLWQVDADECWSSDQVERARQMFLDNPQKRAAFFRCHFFVGPSKIITTYDTYGNQSAFEWLRLWRFEPGNRWVAHEPPILCGAQISACVSAVTRICEQAGKLSWLGFLKNVPRGLRRILRLSPEGENVFSHEVTKANGLVFLHYAYVIPEQIKFKEIYYGYKDCLSKWQRLQEAEGSEVYLRDFFPWVKDGARVGPMVDAPPHYMKELMP